MRYINDHFIQADRHFIDRDDTFYLVAVDHFQRVVVLANKAEGRGTACVKADIDTRNQNP